MQKIYLVKNYGRPIVACETNDDAIEIAQSIIGTGMDDSNVIEIPLVRNCTAVTYRTLERKVTGE